MTDKVRNNTTRVAILVEKNFEDSEFQIPYTALQEAGADVMVLGSRTNETYTGKQGKASIKPDGTTTEMLADDFDAVVIPGGMAPDTMRTNLKTVRFVRDAIEGGKLVAAVCHGPQVLIEGDLLRGKRATGFRAIRKDMENAGANFVDEPLVVDGNLLTSRQPGDLPVFATAILKRLGLTPKKRSLPDENSPNEEWWKLGEEWGGSSKSEIVDALNTGIRGERYAQSAFEHYAEKASDEELRAAFKKIADAKLQHISMLESRLHALGEQESMQAAGSGAYATLKSWLQSSNDTSLLLRGIGDLQTGVVDAYNLRNSLTDPATVDVFDKIEVAIAKHEQELADLYHARVTDTEDRKAAKPTTGTAVSGA